jgi:hypothetical protein
MNTQFSYDKIISNYYNNTFNDYIKNLSTKEKLYVKDKVYNQLTKQIKLLTKDANYLNFVVNNKLQIGLFKIERMHFSKYISVVNNKFTNLIEVYKSLEVIEEVYLTLLTNDEEIKAHHALRLENLILFYKPLIKTIEIYIILLDFLKLNFSEYKYMSSNTEYNIAHLLFNISYKYSDLIDSNDIRIYHKSLFSDLDQYNITYSDLPKINLQNEYNNNYQQIINRAYAKMESIIECS